MTDVLICIIIIIISVIACNYFDSPEVKGKLSELVVFVILKFDSKWKHGGLILRNLYVPKESGETSEIDLLYITQKGIFVIENKNYGGHVFGKESDQNWTVTRLSGHFWNKVRYVNTYQAYNPIKQNRTHIESLKSFLHDDEIKCFSLITFSDRGVLRKINIKSDDVYVCNHFVLLNLIKELWNDSPDSLKDDNIKEIYNKLLPLTKVDKSVKEQHKNNIEQKYGSFEICPVCGKKLVLRTVKKGRNSGEAFLGCSGYPKCKYIKNL